MTHYDRLIDAIVDQIYRYNQETDSWDEAEARLTATSILRIVEEFQTTRSKLKTQWRASD